MEASQWSLCVVTVWSVWLPVDCSSCARRLLSGCSSVYSHVNATSLLMQSRAPPNTPVHNITICPPRSQTVIHARDQTWSFTLLFIKRCFCLTSDVCLSDVCVSRTSGLTRDQRGPGRLKLAHVTRTPVSRSKGQWSTCC